MVSVQVGGIEKDWGSVDQHWLCNEINGRRDDGQSVCVRVRIQERDVDLSLTTPAAPRAAAVVARLRRVSPRSSISGASFTSTELASVAATSTPSWSSFGGCSDECSAVDVLAEGDQLWRTTR